MPCEKLWAFFLYYPYKQYVLHVPFKQFDSIAFLSNIFQIIRSLVSMAQKLKLAMVFISFDHGFTMIVISHT
jgi:hypothetical protein